MYIFWKRFYQLVIFLLLTVLTQIGGVAYLSCLYVCKKVKLRGWKSFLSFAGLYLFLSLATMYVFAPLSGREALPLSGKLRPLNLLTVVLNRHYVRPDLKAIMLEVSEKLQAKHSTTSVNYLDANFPFADGFPLIPHLSHNDGKKLDLAFLYQKKDTSAPLSTAPGFLGYGVFEAPEYGEVNFPEKCKEKGYWQYNLLSFLPALNNQEDYQLDENRTADLIRLLGSQERVSKMFIEPHLQERWKLGDISKIRFHGCHAVRHDDHIHLQIK